MYCFGYFEDTPSWMNTNHVTLIKISKWIFKEVKFSTWIIAHAFKPFSRILSTILKTHVINYLLPTFRHVIVRMEHCGCIFKAYYIKKQHFSPRCHIPHKNYRNFLFSCPLLQGQSFCSSLLDFGVSLAWHSTLSIYLLPFIITHSSTRYILSVSFLNLQQFCNLPELPWSCSLQVSKNVLHLNLIPSIMFIKA